MDIESSFSDTGWGAKGDFRWIFDTNPYIFEGGSPPFCESTCPQGIGKESFGMIGCIFAENGPLEGGIESSFSDTGWGAKGDFRWIFYPNPCIFEGPPTHHFPKAHALRYGHRNLGMIRRIFAENGPLEGGIESSFSDTGWGAKGDFRWIFDHPTRAFPKEPPPTIFRKHMPSGMGTESLGMIGCIFAGISGP